MLAAHDEALGRMRGALGHCLELTPHPARALEHYRDMAALAEALGEWTLAEHWYARSAASSPLAGTPCLERAWLPPLEPGTGGAAPRLLPVWTAFDRHYVTGSLSAYAQHAFVRFEAEPTGPDRDLWAGLAVNAAGILLRRVPEAPWALRLRGLVFAASGGADQAVSDLRRAATAFAAAGLPGDPRLEAELGRLLLAREDLSGALPHLRRAVELDPDAAAPWADLGMALASGGDADGALAALDRAIDLAPARPTPWYNRGLLHLRAQRLDEAERDLSRAADLAPDNPDLPRLLQQIRLARTRPSPGPGDR
jgi:tetratricopeptide (TPR) repeat protein